MSTWRAWIVDPVTVQWVIILIWFAVLETYAVVVDPLTHPLTAHLRPIFQADPAVWFLTFGLWLWLGFHFLVQGQPWRAWYI